MPIRKCLSPATFVTAMISVVLVSTATNAQATRTWVSGVGDDVNPCSRTAPCKTFAGAISKTATGGEINCLDPAGYGPVTIAKSMTIDCTGTFGSILASGTNGMIINAPGGNIRIRGVSINGAPSINSVSAGINGIKVVAAGRVSIENTVIDGFSQSGISVENAGEIKVVVSHSSIRHNVLHGVAGSPAGSADIFIADSTILGNGVGVNAGPNSTIWLTRNVITGNTTGLLNKSGGRILTFRDNSVDGNATNGTPTGAVNLQ